MLLEITEQWPDTAVKWHDSLYWRSQKNQGPWAFNKKQQQNYWENWWK